MPTHVSGNASVSQAGYIGLVNPPTQTNAGSDTSLTFAQAVNTVIIQNNAAAALNYAFDAGAVGATAGSLALAAGQTLIYSKVVTVVHILTASATNVNGTSSGNIVVLGEL